jgi:hypothetical protein
MTDLEPLFPILKPALPSPFCFQHFIRAGPKGASSVKAIYRGGTDRAVRGDHFMMTPRRFAPVFSPAFEVAKS